MARFRVEKKWRSGRKYAGKTSTAFSALNFIQGHTELSTVWSLASNGAQNERCKAMSYGEAERFLSTVENNEELSKQILSTDMTHEDLSKTIKDNGFDVTLEEIRDVAMEKIPLSEDQLDQVAAGLNTKEKALIGVGTWAAAAGIATAAAVAAAI